jgi:hypothetical protein
MYLFFGASKRFSEFTVALSLVRTNKTDPAEAKIDGTPVTTKGILGIAVKRRAVLKCADGEILLQ